MFLQISFILQKANFFILPSLSIPPHFLSKKKKKRKRRSLKKKKRKKKRNKKNGKRGEKENFSHSQFLFPFPLKKEKERKRGKRKKKKWKKICAFKVISDAKKTSFHLSMKQGLFNFCYSKYLISRIKIFTSGRDKSKLREQKVFLQNLTVSWLLKLQESLKRWVKRLLLQLRLERFWV